MSQTVEIPHTTPDELEELWELPAQAPTPEKLGEAAITADDEVTPRALPLEGDYLGGDKGDERPVFGEQFLVPLSAPMQIENAKGGYGDKKQDPPPKKLSQKETEMTNPDGTKTRMTVTQED